MNKKLLVIPILIAIVGGVTAFMIVDSSSVEAVETEEFQNVELVQNAEPEQKQGKTFYVEIHDGVGSSDKLN